MVWVYKANLRGPRGVQGPQGLDGGNAVANDTAGAGYISTAGVSATKTALATYTTALKKAATSVVYKTTGGGVPYTVVRVHTHGKLLPGLVSKEFALAYETAGTTGVNFKPVRENLDAAADRIGATIIANADGWDTAGNVDEIRGAQIREGVVYHDLIDSPLGSDSLGFFADGTSQVFSVHSFGDTMATMTTAGVVNSFSYGPGIVRAGVALDLLADAYWGPAWQTQISARQILGQSITGDIILISVEGKTDISGIGGNDMPALAIAEGCYNAIVLDGGGSSQTMVNGVYTQPSSDTARKRPAPSFLVLNAQVNATFDTGWIPLVLATTPVEYVANGEVPAVRQRGNDVEYRGQVKPLTGSFGATSVTVATLPQRFWPASPTSASKVFAGIGPGVLVRKVLARVTGLLDIGGDTVDAAYVSLDAVRYSLD